MSCNDWVSMKTAAAKQDDAIATKKIRNVSPEQKHELYILLQEYKKEIAHTTSIALSSLHSEFYSYQINQVLTNCQYLFTLEDVYNYVEIWRKVHALSILSMLNKVFCDILEDVCSFNSPNLDESLDSLPDEWISIRDDSEAEDIAIWDSFMLQSINSFGECSQDTFVDNETSMEQSLQELSFNE